MTTSGSQKLAIHQHGLGHAEILFSHRCGQGVLALYLGPNGPFKVNRHYKSMTIPSDMTGVFGFTRHFDPVKAPQETSGTGNLSFLLRVCTYIDGNSEILNRSKLLHKRPQSK